MLVRDDVVGIVGTRAFVQEAPQDLAGYQPAGDDAIGPIRVPGDAFEYRVDIVVREPGPGAGGATDRRLGIDIHALRIERGQERFYLVVAQRPEDLGRDLH